MRKSEKPRMIVSLILAAMLGLSGCTAYAAVPTAGSTVKESMSLTAAAKEPTETAAVTKTSEITMPSGADAAINPNGSEGTETESTDGSSDTGVTLSETMATTAATKTTKATGTTAETTEQPANAWEGDDPTVPTDPPEGTYSADMAQQVLVLVNQARADAGYPALTWNSTLAAACDVRAKELVTNFGHTRPDGSSERTASDGLALGENLARGRDLDTSQAVMDAWMESEGHKNNLLGVTYDYTITAVSCYCVNGVYFWVQEFG